MPATQKFTEVIGLSVIMGGISFVLSIVIAVPLGVLAATKQYSRADYVITSVALVGISLPTFFFATLLKLFFSVKLGWFDLYGLVGRDYAQLDSMGQFLDKANHLVLPIVTLVIVSIGGYMRYTRTNMLEVLNADYIRTARAKGLSERTVIYKHAFRNTLIPLVTIIGGSLPGLFSGALITETLFSIRHRLRLLPVHGRGRHPVHDVLPVLHGGADAGQQPADRYSVRRGRPARAHFLKKGDCTPMSENTQNQNPKQEQYSLNDDRRVKVLSPGALVAKRFFRNRLAVVGLSILVAMFLFSFVGACQPYGQDEQFFTYTQMSKEFVGVTRNDTMRFVVADGQNFGSIAQSKALEAVKKGNTEFNYKDVTTPSTSRATTFTLSIRRGHHGYASRDLVNEADGAPKFSFDVKLAA